MSLNISTHTSTRWILGSLSLIASVIVLLSMVQPWIGLILFVVWVFSGIQDAKGHTGVVRQWISTSQGEVTTDWKNFEADKTVDSLTVHAVASTQHHWWIQRAWLLMGCTGTAWVGVLMNWSIVVFTTIGALWLLSAFGHKQTDTAQTIDVDDGVVIYLPAELSWLGLQTWLTHHQTILPTRGVIVLQCKPSSLPCTLPTGFDGWSVEQRNQSTL